MDPSFTSDEATGVSVIACPSDRSGGVRLLYRAPVAVPAHQAAEIGSIRGRIRTGDRTACVRRPDRTVILTNQPSDVNISPGTRSICRHSDVRAGVLDNPVPLIQSDEPAEGRAGIVGNGPAFPSTPLADALAIVPMFVPARVPTFCELAPSGTLTLTFVRLISLTTPPCRSRRTGRRFEPTN